MHCTLNTMHDTHVIIYNLALSHCRPKVSYCRTKIILVCSYCSAQVFGYFEHCLYIIIGCLKYSYSISERSLVI